jgi:SMODS domain-containing protein
MTKSEYPIVSGAFDLLAKNTELSLGEYTSITQSQADIEHYLMQHFSTFSTVLHGAFSRKTIISPLPGNIVDMLVIFRGPDVKNTCPSRTFSKLKDALIEQYPDGHALNNQNGFMLPVKDFQYKIHPAYPVSNNTYMLPDENFDDWVKYDINSYNEIFVKENVRHKGKLIEIIRMIKTWNRVSGNLFDGYYLELLVTEVLSSYEITSYAETLRHIFRAAVAEVVFQKHDPANMEFQIEGLNDISDLITAMKLLQKSYALADEAILFEQEGNTEKALNNWNKLFPQVFPTQVDMLVGKARSSGIKGADALRMMIKQK